MSTLTGRIEAVGVLELLRIPVTNESTGKLVIFDDEREAELYYEKGRLVCARAGAEVGLRSSASATQCLAQVAEWSSGQFEFLDRVTIAPQHHSFALHEELMGRIKAWYAHRVAKRTASGTMVQVDAPLPAAPPRRLQVAARVAPPNRAAEELSPTPDYQSVKVPKNTADIPIATAEIDRSGNIVVAAGTFPLFDAELAALAVNLCSGLGAKLRAGELRAIEVQGHGAKRLVVKPSAAGVSAAILDASRNLNSLLPGE